MMGESAPLKSQEINICPGEQPFDFEIMDYVLFINLHVVYLLFLRRSTDLRNLKRANKRGFKIDENKE